MTTTETPRIICPHCNSMDITPLPEALREAMIKADNYSQELARTQKNLRAASMERDCEREARQKAEAEVERLNQEVTKGARILATIVDALEQAAPWIKAALNQDKK